MAQIPKIFLPVVTSSILGLSLSSCATSHIPTPSIITNDSTLDVVKERPAVFYENGMLKFYFDKTTADIPDYANLKAKEIVNLAKNGKKLAIVSYDNPNDIKPFDRILAKNRAVAVRNFLIKSGVPDEKIYMMKPIDSTIENSFSRFEVHILEQK